MDPVQLAAVLAAVVVIASMLSVEPGISVALLELGLGVVVGNLFDLNADTPWCAPAGMSCGRGRASATQETAAVPQGIPLAELRACCPMDAGVPGGSVQALAPDEQRARRSRLLSLAEWLWSGR